MNQQEIKANLPHLPFVNCKGYGLVESAMGYEIISTRSEKYLSSTDEATSAAIVSAINNTYGKGINPESVPDMFNQLTAVHFYLRGMGDNKMADIIQETLKNATL
jgi:hypothetical protein